MVSGVRILATQTLIPFFGIKRQYHALREEILHTTDVVLTTGNVLDGDWTRRFEMTMAGQCGRQFGITTNSGTQALILVYTALKAANEKNVNIVCPAVSFAATANAVTMAGCKASFIDVDSHGLMDLTLLNTKANNIGVVSCVNLFGNMLDYDRLRLLTDFFDHDVSIVEDAAQSFGASYNGKPSGSFGIASVLSFDPTKGLANYGSGGMILTDDDNYYYELLNLKNNGKPSDHSRVGTNSKMSEVDCAHMLIKLRHFNKWQERRTQIANYYTEKLSKFVTVLGPTDSNIVHSWSKFVIRTAARSVLVNRLLDNGIESRIHYESSLPNLESHYITHGHWDHATYFCQDAVSLPIYPELTDTEVERIVSTVLKFCEIRHIYT